MSIILGVSINFCKLNSMQDEIKIAIDGQQLSRRRIEESFRRMIRYEWNRQDQILSIRSWRNSFVWRKVEERAVKRRDIYSLFHRRILLAGLPFARKLGATFATMKNSINSKRLSVSFSCFLFLARGTKL